MENLAQIFAFLLQLGVCGQVHFDKPDGGKITVLVCPYAQPAPDAEAPPPPPPARSGPSRFRREV
jgi:hypothetical protein